MRLRTIDLNLLVMLEALVAERSVSNAARRLGLTQSAVSHALRRLRTTFNDELFVKTVRDTGKKTLVIAGVWTEACIDAKVWVSKDVSAQFN